MFYLVLKDFWIQKRYVWFLLSYSAFLFVMFQDVPGSEFFPVVHLMGGIMTTYLLLLQNSVSEEKNNTHLLTNSLPVSRSQVAAARYLTAAAAALLGFLTMGFVGIVLAALPFDIAVEPFRWVGLPAVLAFSLVGTAVYLPLHFAYGYPGARMVGILVFIGLFLLPNGLANMYLQGEGGALFTPLFQWASGHSFWFLGMVGLIISLAAVGLSLVVSWERYKWKDLYPKSPARTRP